MLAYFALISEHELETFLHSCELKKVVSEGGSSYLSVNFPPPPHAPSTSVTVVGYDTHATKRVDAK